MAKPKPTLLNCKLRERETIPKATGRMATDGALLNGCAVPGFTTNQLPGCDLHGVVQALRNRGEAIASGDIRDVERTPRRTSGDLRAWSDERRAQQAAKIHTWKPWQNSTGPRTEQGKSRSSRNADKGLGTAEIREARRIVNLLIRTTKLATHGKN